MYKYKWQYGVSRSQTVTVIEEYMWGAYTKACGVLDKRYEKAGMEPPVGWTLHLISRIKMDALDLNKHKEMLDAAKPLIKWLNENAHPHTHLTVDHDSVELHESQARAVTDEFIKG